jgi:predicted MarR family transcription regulator
MLLKTFIHQDCHVIEYGIKKLQMGSNLEPHKKKKNKFKQKHATK